MTWTNGPMTLYHGTDNLSAAIISTPSPPLNHSISLSRCATLTDFGQGFYTTTNLQQAKNWANNRYRQTQRRARKATSATVLSFQVDRNLLGSLQSMAFVLENSAPDFWDFITYCRAGSGPHLYWGSNYDVVYGSVTLWPQKLVIKDCDQISFHTDRALGILPVPTQWHGTPIF